MSFLAAWRSGARVRPSGRRGEACLTVDFAGRRVIVFFLPSSVDAGVHGPAVDFAHGRARPGRCRAGVVGISPDASGRLKRFGTPTPLEPLSLSRTPRLINAYGAFGGPRTLAAG